MLTFSHAEIGGEIGACGCGMAIAWPCWNGVHVADNDQLEIEPEHNEGLQAAIVLARRFQVNITCLYYVIRLSLS
jgi:hypothetical protein